MNNHFKIRPLAQIADWSYVKPLNPATPSRRAEGMRSRHPRRRDADSLENSASSALHSAQRVTEAIRPSRRKQSRPKAGIKHSRSSPDRYGELHPDSPIHIHAIAIGDRELSLGWELHIRISPNWGKHTLPDRWMWLGRVCYMMNEDAFFIRTEHNTTSDVVAGFVEGIEVTILSTWSDGKNSGAGWIKAWLSWYTTAGPASRLPGSTDTIGPNGNQDYKKEY